MKSYYKKTKMKDGIPLKCFTQRFIQDLENKDITSRYTKNVEPITEKEEKEFGEVRNSPHILIEISQDQFNTLKSITKDTNEKYFEMGGDNYNGWASIPSLVKDLFEKGFEYEVECQDITRKHFEDIENRIKEEQERNNK